MAKWCRPDSAAENATPAASAVDYATEQNHHAPRSTACPESISSADACTVDRLIGKRVEIKSFNRIRDQLFLDDGELSRGFRLLAVENMTVLIIPGSLTRVVEEAHRMSAHGS